jgi:16S rRNA (uracil1498-N3)-methyltransferase
MSVVGIAGSTIGDEMHTAPRLFVTGTLASGGEIAGSAAQAHHLGTVLRRAAGDTVRLFNGSDGEFAARIVALKRDRVVFEAGEQLRPQAPEPDVWLVFAVLKRDATDLVVEKATELGVAALLPVFTERTQAARVNLERLRAIAGEAAAQCERLTVPVVEAPRALPDVLGGWPAERRLAAALERVAAPPLDAPQAAPAALLVGPEGGFTPRELDVLGATPFIQPVSLGPRVLRADTAAIAGLALMLARP